MQRAHSIIVLRLFVATIALLSVCVVGILGDPQCDSNEDVWTTCHFPVWDTLDKKCRTVNLEPLKDKVFTAYDWKRNEMKWKFCGEFDHNECELYKAGACVMEPTFGPLGSWTDPKNRPKVSYSPPTEHMGEGIVFEFRNTMCSGTKRVANTTLSVLCPNPNEEESLAASQYQPGACVFQLKQINKAACVSGSSGSATQRRSASGATHSKRSNSLSITGIVFTVFFMVGFCYVLFGCIYARVAFGLSGLEACPHITFWRELPSHIAEGCSNLYTMVSEFALCKQGRYTSVEGEGV